MPVPDWTCDSCGCGIRANSDRFVVIRRSWRSYNVDHLCEACWRLIIGVATNALLALVSTDP